MEITISAAVMLLSFGVGFGFGVFSIIVLAIKMGMRDEQV